MRMPPGPRRPAAIQALEWAYRPVPFLERCSRLYGDVWTMQLPGWKPFVILSAPEDIKKVFTGDATVLHAGKGNAILEQLVGSSSVLLLDGPEHLRQRRLLLPPFHGERMQAYAVLMREITERAVASWPIGRPFALHTEMQSITLDVILRAVFGLEDGAEMRSFAVLLVQYFTPPPFIFALLPIFQQDLPLSPYRRFLAQRTAVDRELYKIIGARRQESAARKGKRQDILALLLEARDEDGKGMTDKELRDELLTLIAAGHETTATQLSWAFERILAQPPVRERLLAEIDAAGGADLDLDKVKQLYYVDATIKEALRLRPVIPLVVRQLQAPWSVGGYDLPRGVFVSPNIYLTQRRPELYPQPDEFRPERFLDCKPDPYAWLPFGGGIRRCIGMAFAMYEMSIVLSTVLANARLRLAPGPAVTPVRRAITLAPSRGTQVILDERIRRQGAPRAAVG